MKLTEDDGKDLVGRQFQHRLCDRYLKFLDHKFQLRVHKQKEHALKFVNLHSKYQSSKYRHVILNFEHVVKHRENQEGCSDVELDFESDYGMSDAEDHEALTEKKWTDINFALWDTDLARLQYYCSCNAGAQMVNPCAHVAACIYMIIWTMVNLLDTKIAPSKRDVRIKESVTDLHPLLIRWKKQKEYDKKHQVKRYCVCNQPFHGFMVQCVGCEDHFHPECLGLTPESVEQNDTENFKCHWCDPFVLLFKSREKQSEERLGVVPAMENVNEDSTSLQQQENEASD